MRENIHGLPCGFDPLLRLMPAGVLELRLRSSPLGTARHRSAPIGSARLLDGWIAQFPPSRYLAIVTYDVTLRSVRTTIVVVGASIM